MTTHATHEPLADDDPAGSRVEPRRPGAPPTQPWLEAPAGIPRLGTWCGLLLIALGFVLVTIGWVKTSAMTEVALQLPYVISAGFVGLGLVVVGVVAVALDAKAADARARREHNRDLYAALRRLDEAQERRVG